MNEQDRRRVENFRKILDDDEPFVHGISFDVGRKILAIIERLDKENEKLKADLDKVVNALVKS